MIDITEKSNPKAALARRLIKAEIKRMRRHKNFKALSNGECLELLLDSMEQGNSEYKNLVWELREEIKKLTPITPS